MKKLHAVVVFVALSLLSVTAFGHAEEPNAQNIFPTEDGWVLRANFGVVESSQPRRLVCEEAYLGGEGWLLGVLGPTEWVTFGESSVQRTTDGCSFEKVRDLPARPSDATVDAAADNVAYVMNGEEDAGLWVSTDRGVTFETASGIDTAKHQLTGVRFLDGATAIVSGYVRAESGAPAVWSVDLGSGAATALQPPADVTFPYVLATGGGNVLLLARREEQTIFWGPPEELDLEEITLPSWPTGAVLSDDGETAWIGGPDGGRGVLVGQLTGNEATWETIAAETVVNCVARDERSTYVCSLNRFDEFDVLRIDDDGTTEGVIDFREFVGVRQCPESSTVQQVCPVVWREIAAYFGVDPNDVPEDADVSGGQPDAGTGEADGGAARGTGSGEGCCTTVSRTHQAHGRWLLPVLLAGVAAFRRRD